jgi:hypothetical protein
MLGFFKHIHTETHTQAPTNNSHIHTYTHTHLHRIKMCVCVCVCIHTRSAHKRAIEDVGLRGAVAGTVGSRAAGSATMVRGAGEVITVPAHETLKGQSSLLIHPTKGIPQHVVDLLGRPRTAIVDMDAQVRTDQGDKRSVGRISVRPPLVPVRQTLGSGALANGAACVCVLLLLLCVCVCL